LRYGDGEIEEIEKRRPYKAYEIEPITEDTAKL
jgi:hypothetical protein